MKSLLLVLAVTVLAISLSACWGSSDPQACAHVSEQKGTSAARDALKRFLHYTGKTRAPLTGPGGTLDPSRLEHVSDGDLVYDGKVSMTGIYKFHLSWAPQAKFTATLAPDCSTQNNWTIG